MFSLPLGVKRSAPYVDTLGNVSIRAPREQLRQKKITLREQVSVRARYNKANKRRHEHMGQSRFQFSPTCREQPVCGRSKLRPYMVRFPHAWGRLSALKLLRKSPCFNLRPAWEGRPGLAGSLQAGLCFNSRPRVGGD